jgi:hypothetical protein
MSKAHLYRATASILVASLSVAIASPAVAEDEASPVQTADGSFASSNPNLNEWTLINLQATDTAAALDGAGVKVAVLDGEADCRNTALAGHCIFNPIAGATYSRYNAHGTHVSGIVGGNPFGVAPSATILNYGVFSDAGWVATGTKLSDAWKSAYNAGAQISSMSFGCTRKALCFSDYELNTIASTSLPMLFVKAAGNDGSDLVNESTYLSASTAAAALDKILIVGSVNAAGTISTFSNRPGNGCLLAQSTTCSSELSWKNHFLVAPGEAIYSSLPNYTFGYMSGTSMATPVVAGVAALLQARWPFLKNYPETVAKILLTSATDLGQPGVDSVYGYGLINAAAAFQASGSVTIVSPISSTTSSTGSTSTSKSTGSGGKKRAKGGSPKAASVTGGSFARLGSVLENVTVFDGFGRDFRWGETGTLTIRHDIDTPDLPSRRIAGAFTQNSWSPSLFSAHPSAQAFAYYGSRADAPGVTRLAAPSLRLGFDLPLGSAAVDVRLTGAASPKADFAFDPAMRPLAFFASSDLAAGSLVTNVVVPVGADRRLMVYGIAATGTVAADPNNQMVGSEQRRDLQYVGLGRSETATNKNNGIGVGLWQKAGPSAVVGFNLSLIRQKRGFYDATLDVAGLEKPTYVVNAGAAVSTSSAGWDFYLSGEVSRLTMSSAGQPIGFSPTTLVSAEAGVSKSAVLVRGSGLADSIRASLVVPPRAVGGNLRLSYMTPTADGMDVMATQRQIGVRQLGHRAARFEAGYQLSSSSRWSLDLTSGIDLERTTGQKRAAEGFIAFKTAL